MHCYIENCFSWWLWLQEITTGLKSTQQPYLQKSQLIKRKLEIR